MGKLALILAPSEPNTAGYGSLLIRGLDTDITSFTLVIKDGENHLQAPNSGADWGSEKCTFTINNVQAQDSISQAQVGPELVDPIARTLSTTSSFEATVFLADGREYQTHLRVTGELLSSAAQGDSDKPNIDTVSSQPAVVPPPPPTLEPEPEAEPILEPEPIVITNHAPEPISITAESTEKNASILPILLIAMVFLLLALGAGAWWWFSQNKASDKALAEPTSQSTPASQTEIAVSACDISHMSTQADLAFIQSCLKEEPTSTQLLAIIQAAKQAKHCSIAQRLYANRSQAGDLVIASAYVQEYDPKYHQSTDCFAEPNVDTAKYWYETILQADPENTEAQSRLTDLSS